MIQSHNFDGTTHQLALKTSRVQTLRRANSTMGKSGKSLRPSIDLARRARSLAKEPLVSNVERRVMSPTTVLHGSSANENLCQRDLSPLRKKSVSFAKKLRI